MPEPITEIPAHIRSLPESEQGPALVKAIHDRKRALVYGRGFGKTAAVRQWLDEMAAAATQDRLAIVRDVAARGLTPPKADDTPLTVCWACLKPTDPPTEVLYEDPYWSLMRGVRAGLGENFIQTWLEKR